MIFTTTLSIQKKFDANLLFTEINSLTYEIKSEDLRGGFSTREKTQNKQRLSNRHAKIKRQKAVVFCA